ncbi:MAG: gluconokinase [Cyclobacteriaceae bacterium]|nr:gluconokinase [Cyclobacteriaceae bacterium]
MECIITIELGTNGVRLFAFDLNGNVINSTKASYPTFHSEPDYSEQDPEQIFITMLYVLKNFLIESIHPQRYKVQSICFIASMHSLLAVDAHGAPLGNVITWADNRGKKEALDLKNSQLGTKLYEATGTPIHPMSPLLKILWLKKNDSHRFEQAYKFLTLKSYILHQLTGDYVIDYSLASATGLLNIHTLKWETQALDYAGITVDRLPELCSVFTTPGKLRKEYQTSLGLSANTRIIIGSSDGCMATLGAGVWGDDKATITIEDSGAVRVVGKQILRDDQKRFFNYLLTENYYISGGPTNSGGVIFDWFANQFGEFKGPFDLEYTIETLIHEASNVVAGSEGLLFLPYLLGERAPLWNPNARGSYFGINIKHERKHFIRATIEGILYEIYSIGKMVEEHRSINSLSVNGSFAAIPFCSQLIADIFNKPVSTINKANSAGLGAFLLTATDMGIYRSLDEAAKSVVFHETFRPRHHDHKIYAQYYQLFERLSLKLEAEFEMIAKLQQIQ